MRLLIFIVAMMTAIITNANNANSNTHNAGDDSNNGYKTGVDRQLALERARMADNICYSLYFNIPADRKRSVSGKVAVAFRLKEKGRDLVMDFAGKSLQGAPAAAKNGSVEVAINVNGKRRTATWTDEHVMVAAKWLKRGLNNIEMEFESDDKPLNRNVDYMYSLFVPDHARQAFPCFDQPDMKARFSVKLQVPEGWQWTASVGTEPIPTYLFSFVAGRFHKATAVRSGRTLTALYREDDPKKVAQLDTVFSLADRSIKWLEEYTAIPYPFSSYGFVVLPAYQFGGMEHPGAIQFTDHEIFLPEHPTPEELQTRLELVAHETAHCWFGDMVTMRWFDDVWTKEVFANFLASKIAKEQYPEVNHDLNFLRMYQTRALSTERTAGTHAIQQQLDNLNQAGLLYGNIIYCKAPVMMRKLEQLMGAERMQSGLQEYLRSFAYGNASWDDLIAILDRHAPEARVADFSRAWVKEKGMPTVDVEWKDGFLVARQTDPWGRDLCWQQRFSADAVFVDSTADGGQRIRTVSVPFEMSERTARVRMDRRPQMILPNADGEGYGLFLLPEGAWQMEPPADPLKRFAMAMNMNENFLAGRVSPSVQATAMSSWIRGERNSMIASQMASYWASAMMRMEQQEEKSVQQRMMWTEYRRNSLPSVRQQLLRLLYGEVTDSLTADSIYMVWKGRTDNLMSANDYTRMAYRLAILMPDRWQQILKEQRSRLTNGDELRRFDFVSRACSPDTAVQQRLFDSLLVAENRRVEPWAQQMLQLLNDVSREPFANRYLLPGMEALEDVQRTGDIFFPGYWLQALFSGHRSAEARRIVKAFIEAHPDYPPKLMCKLKENAFLILQ